ncbi:MAG: UDP-N-acetylmuramoyl-L-alanyl-D-glutamate--2,6-diaminopimelate ligase [Fimbriimonadaceae bacterium]|nr:UDP-N-acetylmuramoyl-L-alanyl-D-glutamate--2,6-diaminopimelate ligase [Fimbriimonadaceae bacterium]
MTFQQLFTDAGVQPDRLSGETEVSGVCEDTRKVKPSDVFLCMPSPSRDTHDFLEEAKASGAVAALAHSEAGYERAIALGLPAALVTHEGLRFWEALWRVCKVAFGDPSSKLKMIGVTGTNGKTSTAWLIRDMLEQLSVPCAYIGTLGFQRPGMSCDLPNTTPFSPEVNRMLAECVENGVQAVAMEVSSHALAERRIDGVEFDAAVFTNLTQDHLDFHGTMEEYEAAKWRLFSELPKQMESGKEFKAVINVSDPVGRKWSERIPCLRYGMVDEHEEGVVPDGYDLVGSPYEIDLDFVHVSVDSRTWIDQGFGASLGGHYNAENLMSAFAATIALDFDYSDALEAARGVRPVPGRFEPMKSYAGFDILIDYAHTPDALVKLLDTIRSLAKGRIITVFGCGGDRDKTKRPLMARAASERSDITIVTSDNPRTEDPQAIIDDVVKGIVPGRESVTIVDRPEAVAYAMKIARQRDVVVIAGKGHENYQIIGKTKYPMDDRELARAGLEARRR